MFLFQKVIFIHLWPDLYLGDDTVTYFNVWRNLDQIEVKLKGKRKKILIL